MSHHIADPVCPSCEDKLTQAHPNLRLWFHDMKSRHGNAHVSWSYRDLFSQNKAYQEGASKLQYPNSAHNKTDKSGNPCSRALDIFQLDDNGIAVFDPVFCAQVNDENDKAGIQMRWGGRFRTLGDSGHFELPVDIAQP